MPADPAGIFASDEHRRVLGNLGTPRTLDEVAHAVYIDPNTQVWPGDPGDHSTVESIIDDLQNDGYVKKADGEGRFEFSAKGLEALQADPEHVPPPMDPERARQLQEDFAARERALLDQERERSAQQIKDAAEQALRDLDANIASHDKTLKRLVKEGVPSEEAE